jgi:hypothetical protein
MMYCQVLRFYQSELTRFFASVTINNRASAERARKASITTRVNRFTKKLFNDKPKQAAAAADDDEVDPAALLKKVLVDGKVKVAHVTLSHLTYRAGLGVPRGAVEQC